jgi:hypothetical protein
MIAYLQYYRKFTGNLLRNGVVLNPYDLCVANKTIKSKQMTICFHVDECKISHKSPKFVSKVIQWLRSEYESIFEDGSGLMKVSRGKVHNYLSVTLDFSILGQVKTSMFEYVKGIIDAFASLNPKALTGRRVRSAAPEDLFKVNDALKTIPTERQEAFRTIVAKTVFATNRARPDACKAIAFLTTRVGRTT